MNLWSKRGPPSPPSLYWVVSIIISLLLLVFFIVPITVCHYLFINFLIICVPSTHRLMTPGGQECDTESSAYQLPCQLVRDTWVVLVSGMWAKVACDISRLVENQGPPLSQPSLPSWLNTDHSVSIVTNRRRASKLTRLPWSIKKLVWLRAQFDSTVYHFLPWFFFCFLHHCIFNIWKSV